jgi:N-formylglutamate deformylase
VDRASLNKQAKYMTSPLWTIVAGEGPIIAVAVHDGHGARDEIRDSFAISEADRLREEDPFTGGWTSIAPTKIVAHRSRFEVDLNRSAEKAVYQTPADAWGLTVWKDSLTEKMLARSRAIRTEFYAVVERLLESKLEQHDKLVIYEIHSYNHHRGGPAAAFDDPQENPQVNLGTGYVNLERWGTIQERFMRDIAAYNFPGGKLDVRENVKFHGGYFAQWIGERFPDTICNLCIEFKKFFMDEWTGKADPTMLAAIQSALESTVPGVQEELAQL